MNNLKKLIAESLKDFLKMGAQELEDLISQPPNIDLGDYTLPCFQFSKVLKKSPQVVAQELREHLLKKHLPVKDIKIVSGYLNFFIDRSIEIDNVIREILKRDASYGNSDIGNGSTVVVDFSSPNVAKPIALHHLRSTMIGNSICNILDFVGYDVIRLNYLGDWGTNYGKLIVAFNRWGEKDRVDSYNLNELVNLYQKFEKEKDEALEKEARDTFRKMEQGSGDELELWKKFREISIREFEKVYNRLGVRFDSIEGESLVNEMIEDVINEIEEKISLKESKGAKIIELGEGVPPVLIKKSDGATLYSTREIAEAFRRYEKYKFSKSLYVVATQQNLHLKSVFQVLDLLGKDWANRCEHVPFGMMFLNDEKMATRSGNIIFLEDVLNKAKDLSIEIIYNKNPDLKDKDQVAEKVGVGAIVFNDLKNKRIKDVTFNWQDALNFDGETGPYVQYTYARIGSVLQKAVQKTDTCLSELLKFDSKKICLREEVAIVKVLGQFPELVLNAAREYEPSVVAKYTLNLCSIFNSFYNKHKVIGDDVQLQKARLALVYCVREVISSASKLLGLPLPERM